MLELLSNPVVGYAALVAVTALFATLGMDWL